MLFFRLSQHRGMSVPAIELLELRTLDLAIDTGSPMPRTGFVQTRTAPRLVDPDGSWLDEQTGQA
jgi:hypothetical protein